jgi:NitT/TauT family transport system substrate-binding protein
MLLRTGAPVPAARIILFTLISLLLLPSLIRADDLKRLRYGVSLATTQLPIWAAKDGGLFAKNGLDVEVILMRGGPLNTLALLSGQMQISSSGAESVVAARTEGADLVLLACPTDIDPVYLIARPELKQPADLKGKTTAVTRLGSTTHFYLRAALKQIGIDADKEVRALQLGTSSDIVVALETGKIGFAALTLRSAIRFLDQGWPLFVDLTRTNLAYPASCVTSSRAYIRAEPKATEDFLRAYVAAINLIRRDHHAAEKSFAKWLREQNAALVKRSVAAYAPLWKRAPIVPDKGIDNVVKDLMRTRPEFKEYVGWPEPFRENRPLEKVLREK